VTGTFLAVDLIYFFMMKEAGIDVILLSNGIRSAVTSQLLTYILAMLLVSTLNKAVERSQDESEKNEKLYLMNVKLLDEVKKQVANLLASSENMAKTSQNISASAQRQASSVEEISASLEEMGSTISQNAANAQEVNQMSDDTLNRAEQGGNIVERAIGSIDEMNRSSSRIGDIIAVINDIAFQTNLLALNAAVEAARAGDQGRGFAVVAGEVRNLAQRSGNSSREIGELIKDSIEKVGRGTQMVYESGEALLSIIESMRKVRKLISEIAVSIEEQKHGIDQINNAILDMDEMTQNNASASEELAQTAKMLSESAEQLQLVVSTEAQVS
jgi:methyl-accepting chemotaxis protein